MKTKIATRTQLQLFHPPHRAWVDNLWLSATAATRNEVVKTLAEMARAALDSEKHEEGADESR